MQIQSTTITDSAAAFLIKAVPAIADAVIESQWGGRPRIPNTPEARQALAKALETARSRGVRSSLRAALRRLDPEAVPSPAKPGEAAGGRLLILWKRKGARTWKMQGTATSEGSLGTLAALIRAAEGGHGRLRVLLADSAAEARRSLALFEEGSKRFGVIAGTGGNGSDPKQARVLGLGLTGAMAVWRVAGPDARGAWTGTGAAIEPSVFSELVERRAR